LRFTKCSARFRCPIPTKKGEKHLKKHYGGCNAPWLRRATALQAPAGRPQKNWQESCGFKAIAIQEGAECL
jgi:hypothetical protein